MKVKLSFVHSDDRQGAVVGRQVDLNLLRGKRIRMTPMAASQSLRTTRMTLLKMVKLGMVERGEPLPPVGGIPRWWILLDPADTKRTVYDRFIETAKPARKHCDFDRYLRAREMCGIPAAELPPEKFVPGMVALLMEIGSSDPSEIAAFTPHDPASERDLQVLINQGAAWRIPKVAEAVRPSEEMILAAVPALAGAPGTAFDVLFGGEDLAMPRDNALRAAWAQKPMRAPTLLWAHLAASSKRPAKAVRAGVRRLGLLDQALTAIGGRHDDPAAIGQALESIAFGPEFSHVTPYVRAQVALLIPVMIRQLRIYAARNDADGSRGLKSLVPAEHPSRLDFSQRVRRQYEALELEGRERRKRRSDRAADQYADMVDIVALRMEQIMSTQACATAAAEALKERLAGVADEDKTIERFEEFGVASTILTHNGKLLPGSQICWWRAWRERDLWRHLVRRTGCDSYNDNQIYLRLQAIEADPEAFTGIVYEWLGCEQEVGEQTIAPWFVTISNLGVLQAPASLTWQQRRRRHQLIATWNLPAYGRSQTGLLNFDRVRNTLWRWTSKRKRFVVPIDEFAYAMRFAQLGLNTVDECMCRVSELLQMRQDREAWPTTGEIGSEEVSFLAIPKTSRYLSSAKAVPYQIEQVTFVEACELAAEVAKRAGFADGLLPEIKACQSLAEKYEEPQAWIFQFDGRAISSADMNRFVRFLLGNVVSVSFHELRHAAANAARVAGMDEEAVQAILKHRTLNISRWYMRHTQRQALQAQLAKVGRSRCRSAHKRATAKPSASKVSA